MPTTAGPIAEPERDHDRRVVAARPGLYSVIILATVLAASGYKLRRDGVFSCQASGYLSNHYLAYCQATSYGDYDYGAFWFGLEPPASAAATTADVLFLGDSRMQFGISTDATAHWFSAHSLTYYLLGFAYNGNYGFEAPLLRRLGPRAQVYVINLDRFFEDSLTPPAKTVMRDSTARTRYEQKRLWQRAHEGICGGLPSLCGHEIAFFRSRATGAWTVTGGRLTAQPVSYVERVDPDVLKAYETAARAFLSHLPVSRNCVLLTIVPTAGTAPGTGAGTAKAIAAALGVSLVGPELAGLSTFDGSHLDHQSAERWSTAFIEAAGPKIVQCLAPRPP
jgi:hypothetical protein